MDESGNLPTELASFVGRAAELTVVGELLAWAPVITLTGVAGVGKSRTALAVGERAAGEFADGVWLIPLSPVREGDLVPHAVARELKVRDQTARPVTELLIEYLAGRQCLLILDACEHVLAGCAALAEALREHCPGVRMLATSRRPLGVRAEITRQLSPLTPPSAHAWDDDDSPAMALLVARARALDPDFSLDENNRHALVRLCRRLEGLPLALELAAAQLREQPVAELAERADPQATSRVLATHGGLWTAIGWSHELCAPLERLLWARASIFVGTFTVESVQDVCAGGPLAPDQIPAILDRLVTQSVMTCVRGNYNLLDSLRDYGRFWLEELGELDTLRARHRDRYLTLARQAFPEWTRAGQTGYYQRLASEFSDLQAAIETCLAEPGESALDLVGALWFFWFSCEYEREGRDYLERALARGGPPDALRVRAAWALGLVMNAQGDMAGIEKIIEECRSAAPDPTALRAADYLEGTAWALEGRPDLALERLATLAEEPWDDSLQEAIRLLTRAALVFARFAMGELEQAADLAESLRREGLARGERKFGSWGDYIHALIALVRDDHVTAVQHALTGYDGFRQLNDSSNMALCLEALAIAKSGLGSHEDAARLLGISDRLWHPDGGRVRFTAPYVARARQDTEQRIAAVIGGEATAMAFRSGLHGHWP
ncbi:ATP-binding protein [Nonomuraea endophytica]|uniref:ATP-binding protein n=1 Tax=Nonomuraea endophytica TaxID=714136 RepID=UPI0037C97B0D